jgi:glycolate oxidase FAD binding subunit
MPVLEQLAANCGPDQVRAATDADAVDGVRPRFVLAAKGIDDVVSAMAVASEHQLSVVARGAGSKLDWGLPPASLDLVVDVSGMDAVLEHAAGDLIVRVEPGVRLSSLQDARASAGQRLAIDEVVPGSTVGGVVATALSGPSRFLHGAPRDLLIGITVVRADGVVARSGGRVVKNVAGYDLCKLYTGSFGTLGVIVEAIFRLHPIPEATAYVSLVASDESVAGSAVAAIVGSQVVPAAVEIERATPGGPLTVCAQLEGTGPGVRARAARLVELLGADATTAPDRPTWWARLPAGATTIRLTAPLSKIPHVVGAVDAAGSGLGVALSGSAGSGVVYAGLDSHVDMAAVADFLGTVRTACSAAGGAAVVVRAPAAVKEAVDVWGPIPAISLMRRVKTRFDPGGRLSPGRFVGGI